MSQVMLLECFHDLEVSFNLARSLVAIGKRAKGSVTGRNQFFNVDNR